MDCFYYTAEQIASLLQVSEESVRSKIRKGKIKGIKIGKLWRVSNTALEKYLEEEDL